MKRAWRRLYNAPINLVFLVGCLLLVMGPTNNQQNAVHIMRLCVLRTIRNFNVQMYKEQTRQGC